jgi:hypothetical protein
VALAAYPNRNATPYTGPPAGADENDALATIVQQPGEPNDGYITPDDMDVLIRILLGRSGAVEDWDAAKDYTQPNTIVQFNGDLYWNPAASPTVGGNPDTSTGWELLGSSAASTFYGILFPTNTAAATPGPDALWIVTPLAVVVPGVPGAISPVPANLPSLQIFGNLGQTTRWPVGSYVVLGDNSEAFWNGSRWEVGRATPPPATGVTVGQPGAWSPAGALPPANIADLQLLGPMGHVLIWPGGAYVTLGDGSEAYWSGPATGWVAGRAPRPAPTGIAPAAPGIILPVGSQVPADLAALRALAPLGQNLRWFPGHYVVLGDASEAWWDGTNFVAGRAT